MSHTGQDSWKVLSKCVCVCVLWRGDFCFTMEGRSTLRAMSSRGIGRKGQCEGRERLPLFSLDSRAWLFGEETGDAQRMRTLACAASSAVREGWEEPEGDRVGVEGLSVLFSWPPFPDAFSHLGWTTSQMPLPTSAPSFRLFPHPGTPFLLLSLSS